jgi:hypothetical protein
MKWLILCSNCCEDLDPDQIEAIFEAKYGPIEVGENIEGSILACSLWRDRRENVPAWQFFCDECGAAVSVAESSQWFIDAHRKEREGQIERA